MILSRTTETWTNMPKKNLNRFAAENILLWTKSRRSMNGKRPLILFCQKAILTSILADPMPAYFLPILPRWSREDTLKSRFLHWALKSFSCFGAKKREIGTANLQPICGPADFRQSIILISIRKSCTSMWARFTIPSFWKTLSNAITFAT